jgi:ATP phosphoribosyltransferase
MQLSIAIQKGGRLHEESVRLLRDSGIAFSNGLNALKVEATNFPLTVLLLRDDDIPQYVEDGVADVGIVGENVLLESGRNAHIVDRLGFGRCRLSLAVPKDRPWNGIADLRGQRIATSYPVILQRYLDEQGIAAEIHAISGSVEIAPGIGLADAICDLVSTGSTLLVNGLVEVETILRSEAVLIAGERLDDGKRAVLERLRSRMEAVRAAQRNKYILLNAPNERLADICRILPGIKSPTVLPLAESGWSSVHSVVHEDVFWDLIEELRAAGAQGILVIPIEKMIAA